MIAALLLALATLVAVATVLAVAGRWQPEGLLADPPAAGTGDPARFEVVLRGYRMDQVDAELARLHGLLAQPQEPSDGPGVPQRSEQTTIEM